MSGFLDLLMLPLVTVMPLCGVVFLIVGFWRRGSKARLTDAAPKTFVAFIYWGIALLVLTLMGWFFLYFASDLAEQARQSDRTGELGVFFLFLTAILLMFLIPLLILIGFVFLIRGVWLQSKNRQRPQGEKVEFKRNYIWGLCLILAPCLLIPVIALGLEPLGAMVM